MAISDIVKGAGERQLRELAEAGLRAKTVWPPARVRSSSATAPVIR